MKEYLLRIINELVSKSVNKAMEQQQKEHLRLLKEYEKLSIESNRIRAEYLKILSKLSSIRKTSDDSLRNLNRETERQEDLIFIETYPESKEKKIFHGGCLDCSTPVKKGVGTCLGCSYANGTFSGYPSLHSMNDK